MRRVTPFDARRYYYYDPVVVDRRRAGAVGGAAFSPLSLAPFAWYDPSDLSTLFQDSAMTTPVTAADDPVGAMLDKSGNGRHLTQATANARPLYKTSGGLSWLEFDGTNDYLAGSYGATLDQPFDRIGAWRLLATDDAQVLIGWTGGNKGWLGRVFTANFGLFDNSNLVVSTTTPATDADFVSTDRVDGGSSRLAIDNGSYATGTIGAGGHDNIEIAVQSENAPDTYANIMWYGLIQVASALTDAQIASARTWIALKQGRVL